VSPGYSKESSSHVRAFNWREVGNLSNDFKLQCGAVDGSISLRAHRKRVIATYSTRELNLNSSLSGVVDGSDVHLPEGSFSFLVCAVEVNGGVLNSESACVSSSQCNSDFGVQDRRY